MMVNESLQWVVHIEKLPPRSPMLSKNSLWFTIKLWSGHNESMCLRFSVNVGTTWCNPKGKTCPSCGLAEGHEHINIWTYPTNPNELPEWFGATKFRTNYWEKWWTSRSHRQSSFFRLRQTRGVQSPSWNDWISICSWWMQSPDMVDNWILDPQPQPFVEIAWKHPCFGFPCLENQSLAKLMQLSSRMARHL